MRNKLDTTAENQIKLTTRVSATEQQIKTLETNISNELAILESQASDNITSLTSGVLDVLSITVKSDPQKFFKIIFGGKDIALWDMSGKYPPKQVFSDVFMK